ncbi:MAG: helicase-related protein, partial [Candidatus Saccharimonas sp.]
VHEWNNNIEMMIAWVKRQLVSDTNLKVVITSATMDTDRLQEYFNEVVERPVPLIDVPGRSYPVEFIERPDSTVVDITIEVAKPGAGILIFVAGKREIRDVIDEIRRRLPHNILEKAVIYPLHSKLSQKEQQRACEENAEIKIVVATNVAQTSLTIEGITHVIDSAEERRTDIDKRGVQGLFKRPISQAAHHQRGGRAGRLSPGIAYRTRLDGKSEFVPFNELMKYDIPEILRSDLARQMLSSACVGVDFATLDLVHPVPLSAIMRAEETLRILGAFDNEGDVTEIGKQMNRYPLRPSLARTLVEAENHDADIRVMAAAMAAVVEVGGLPNYDRMVKNRWRDLSDDTSSDLIAQLDLFVALHGKPLRYIASQGIDTKNFERASEVYDKLRRRLSVSEGELISPNETHRETLRHCIYAGYSEHIFRRVGRNAYTLVGGSMEDRFEISDRSVVDSRSPLLQGRPYTMERYKHGVLGEYNIIESVTRLDSLQSLGKYAEHLTTWNEGDIQWREGYPVRQQVMIVGGERTAQMREVATTPSPELRESVINYALNHPGPAQRYLRDLKQTIELLDHRAAESLDKLTHDNLFQLVHRSAAPDITDPQDIEAALWVMIQNPEEKLTLDDFVGPKDQLRITANSPEHIMINGENYALEYRRHLPVVREYHVEDMLKLPASLCLPDGREIRFFYDNAERTIESIRERIAYKNRMSQQREERKRR